MNDHDEIGQQDRDAAADAQRRADQLTDILTRVANGSFLMPPDIVDALKDERDRWQALARSPRGEDGR